MKTDLQQKGKETSYYNAVTQSPLSLAGTTIFE